MTTQLEQAQQAAQVAQRVLRHIAQLTDADDPQSLRGGDGRECMDAVHAIAKMHADRLRAALAQQPQQGQPPRLTDEQVQHIMGLVNSACLVVAKWPLRADPQDVGEATAAVEAALRRIGEAQP